MLFRYSGTYSHTSTVQRLARKTLDPAWRIPRIQSLRHDDLINLQCWSISRYVLLVMQVLGRWRYNDIFSIGRPWLHAKQNIF